MFTSEQITEAYNITNGKYATPEKKLTPDGEAIATALHSSEGFKKNLRFALVTFLTDGPAAIEAVLMSAFMAGLELGSTNNRLPKTSAPLEGRPKC